VRQIYWLINEIALRKKPSVMNQLIPDGVDEIDSFDAYYSNVYLDQKNLVIPYINLGVSRHPLHRGDRLEYLDFAYMVFLGLRYLKVQRGVLLGENGEGSHIFYFGGFNLDPSSDLVAFEIECESAFLQSLATTSLSDTIWVPVESPLRNLDQGKVAAFFRGEMMPEFIRQLVANRSTK
jgi:hypothetical protein